MSKKFIALFAGLSLVAGVAFAQTISVPQVSVINNGDLFQDVVNGQPSAQSQFASALQLAGYTSSLPARANVLIGGDATTNLFQRGTTGSSVTTTTTFGGPDRWAYWSGTNTAMTVSRDSTAADLPASGYLYGFKMARTSSQTGVVQVCMAQEVESANSYQFAGQTAEFDFHATAGANFSAASSQMTAYIVYGTGSDEGVASLAKGLNGGGGGSAGWTGQANASAAVVTLNSGNGRYAAVGTIPTTATEIGVALCFTPVGTASTNDYIAFSGIQLVRNTALASKASATLGYSCDNQLNAVIQCTSFDRSRNNAQESNLQYRYYYEIDEATGPSVLAVGRAHSVTVAEVFLSFPVIMRIVPTMTYVAGFATETTTAGGTLGACSGVATSSTVTSTAAALSGVSIACTATTVPAAGSAVQLFNNGGSGKIKASAEMS